MPEKPDNRLLPLKRDSGLVGPECVRKRGALGISRRQEQRRKKGGPSSYVVAEGKGKNSKSNHS